MATLQLDCIDLCCFVEAGHKKWFAICKSREKREIWYRDNWALRQTVIRQLGFSNMSVAHSRTCSVLCIGLSVVQRYVIAIERQHLTGQHNDVPNVNINC